MVLVIFAVLVVSFLTLATVVKLPWKFLTLIFAVLLPFLLHDAITPLTMGPIGTTLGWSHPSNTSAAKPFPWYLVVTANHTVNCS